MKAWRLFLFWLVLLSPPVLGVEYFPLDQVRLLDGPFKQAQDRDIEYILALEPDRLLAPYLIEAGLEPKAEQYGNWESTGLDGHIGGHYLTALALGWAATGRDDLLQRLNYVLGELRRAQLANGNGYVGGVPNGKALWRELASGDVRGDLFGLNGYWVPWYNLHKVFAGLRDAWLYARLPLARTMLIEWADWAAGLVDTLSDEQMQAMLRTEHGGMNEVFADVAVITGEERYLETARRFSHRFILDPLLVNEDRLDGLHANTQIPKVVGFERIAEASGDSSWHRAAAFFWDTVVNRRSVAIGGNSVREHFHDANDFSSMIEEVEGPETCNTYNMLKLTRLLYQSKPDQKYVDYYERALYNHILSSQDPLTGGLVYFTPMRPQHYRVYSRPQDAMWCCVGSGIENHVKYGEFIYAHEDDELLVNLFIPSRLSWAEKGLVLRQETRFPDREQTQLVFETATSLAIRLRTPAWLRGGEAQISLNGEALPVRADSDGYVRIERDWQAGDTLTLKLPANVRQEALPDGSNYYALFFGPVVLAAATDPFPGESLDFYADDSRMGHIAGGEICPVDRVPTFISDTPDLAGRLVRMEGEPLRFRLMPENDLESFQPLELEPFFRVHHTRYMLYWPHYTETDLMLKREHEAAEEAARIELERLTIDQVSPGEQQPEAEHDFDGVDTEAGVNFGRHWRHAAGWFGYRLADPDGAARYLRIDYWGADAGRTFSIEMNGVTVATVTSTGEHGPQFISIDYPLDESVLANRRDGTYFVRFIAGDQSIAGGIYGVRLMSDLPARDRASRSATEIEKGSEQEE